MDTPARVGEQGTRSLTRGCGPARQSAALRLEELLDGLPQYKPLAKGGPVNPVGAVALGCGLRTLAGKAWASKSYAAGRDITSRSATQTRGRLGAQVVECMRSGSVALCLHHIAMQHTDSLDII